MTDLTPDALFKPPADDVPLAVASDELNVTRDGFYVVSPRKLVVLYVSTLGIYSVVWFYKHWNRVRESEGSDASPLGRAIFALLFTHDLFRRIQSVARAEGVESQWKAESDATMFVCVSIAATIASRFDATSASAVSIALSMVGVVPLLRAQRVANAALGDADGARNSGLSGGNVLAILLGALFWLLAIAGLVLA